MYSSDARTIAWGVRMAGGHDAAACHAIIYRAGFTTQNTPSTITPSQMSHELKRYFIGLKRLKLMLER